MSEPKALAAEIARQHFYSPGAFNEGKFAKDYALFMILRKQCLRFTKTGEINYHLALNNTVVALNSFGKVATNEIIRLLFEPQFYSIAAAILWYLRADVPRVDESEMDHRIVDLLIREAPRYNLEH
ncbi:hypothetical protein FDI24_gp132 [Acidovorax phage ACP17]|uniref:Uncharacterized protein n=1 Tax=Acidovorax phage ACP17 TaxID=2010329 RepID=A0A218M2Z8_9CAUD|nr:hypothetical protein FDI24_gp132 [Acidovorax phage ACP17]ASD50413.1 hypothetical protein [Acidovorax phage ACP17]